MKSGAEDAAAVVTRNEPLAEGISDIRLELPKSRAVPLPGQFAHVFVPGVFLRRPISIAGFKPDKSEIRLIVRNSGRGTDALVRTRAGDGLRALLPLGNSYAAEKFSGSGVKDIWLAGGGIGAAPLLYAAEYLSRASDGFRIKSFLGFRSEGTAYCADEFKLYGEVSLSVGGIVTDKLSESLTEGTPDVILACGPAPMLAALQKICLSKGLRAFVYLEARM
ncbi:MAG: hypothetical protein LBR87_01190 [Synergistaceae bacterium]|nr:hypothetical protein [Synergistaceae bacterium]